MTKAGSDVKTAVEKPVKPASADPASSEAQPAEPIKSAGTSNTGDSSGKPKPDPEPQPAAPGDKT